MKTRKLLLGLIGGAAAGYVAVRTLQALATMRGGTLSPSTDSHAYGRTQRALAVSGALRSALGTIALAYGPVAPRFERALAGLPAWARPGAFFGVLALATSAIDVPSTFVEDHLLERKYGLSEQSTRDFFVDYAKGSLLGGALAAGLGLLGGVAVRRTGRWWPAVASVGMLPLFVLANLIVPVYILPLFNKFEPLTGPLEVRLRALAARFGVGDAEILRMDMSRQTKKANAFVAGVGSTHRIVLGDTLIDKFEPGEIEFVVAHELGHYVTRDTWRMIALAGTATAVLLGMTALILHDDESPTSVYLARISSWLGLGTLAGRPIINAFSRSREWAADRFALATTRDARSGAAAFARLRNQNMAEDELPAWYEFFFASHPSLGKRIAALERV